MPLIFHGNTNVEGETSIKDGHDVGNGCAVLDARLGSSLGDSQTGFSLPSVALYPPEDQTLMTRAAVTTQQTHDVLPSPPSPYDRKAELGPAACPRPPFDDHHGSLTPNTGIQPRATVQQYPSQRPRNMRRRPTRPFRRSFLPEDGTTQGTALQPEGETENEPNAAWKRQMRDHRLALNALCEARQQAGEATAVPNNGGNNEAQLSGFNTRYQEYLGRRGLSNIDEFTRRMERLFDGL